ncbi:uncharacterized protein C15orf39 homolog [Latimeria chalumnae]|uniref:uncharacterized protein C15orf39 homolog n=1 Tax=Latimeria chalumnae TaxID=7897 RepID=UPI0006D92D0C|nr:PREDICTED: uncharacterized protein C15orf39 homolog [Latimeria chalumnae]|eukprot:XP_014353077.1 PREDICTED: uncharacterized protein C15orf39 homolog [Latimeria chalumnae]
MMASKRQLGYVDPLSYSKIPRIEKETDLTKGLCKPSLLPSYDPKDPLKYSGSYLTYRLRHQDGPDSPPQWSPTAAYLQRVGNPVSQCLVANGSLANGLAYWPETEVLTQGFQPVSEKDRQDLVRDLVNAREKWANFVEHQENITGQNTCYPVRKPTAVSNMLPSQTQKCVNLAVPKPVYRTSICCTEPGCNSRTCFQLENQMDSLQRRPHDVEWSLSPSAASAHLIHGEQQLVNHHYRPIVTVDRKSMQPDSSPLQLEDSGRFNAKEPRRTQPVYTTLQQAYEKYGAVPVSSLPDPKYSVYPYDGSKRMASSRSSPCRNTLQELQKIAVHPLATLPVTHAQMSLYQDRLPSSKYPPFSHQQMVVCPQGTSGSVKQSGTSYTLPQPSCNKGFSIPLNAEPVSVSSSYFEQHSPRTHYPTSLEAPLYQPTVPAQNGVAVHHVSLVHPTVRNGRLQRDVDVQTFAGYKLDSLQQFPNFAFSSETSPYRSQVIMDNPSEQPVDCSVSSVSAFASARETGRPKPLLGKHSAFQPVYSGSNLKTMSEHILNGLHRGDPAVRSNLQQPLAVQMENSISVEEAKSRVISSRELERLDRKVNVDEPTKSAQQGQEPGLTIPIVIEDSPGKTEIREGGDAKENAPRDKSLISPTRQNLLPLKERLKSLEKTEEERMSSPPSSPPMPVIHNVFSLAPYKAYLEASGLLSAQKNGKCQAVEKGSSVSTGSRLESHNGSDATKQERTVPSYKISPEPSKESCKTEPPAKVKDNGDGGVSLRENGSKEKAVHKLENEMVYTDTRLHTMNFSFKAGNCRSQNHCEAFKCMLTTVKDPCAKKRESHMEVDTILDLSLKKQSTEVAKTDVSKAEQSDVNDLDIKGTGIGLRDVNKTEKIEKPEAAEADPDCEEKSGSQSSGSTMVSENVKPVDPTLQSSSAFMFQKFKIQKPPSVKIGEVAPMQQMQKYSEEQHLRSIVEKSIPTLKLASFKLILPDIVKSIPSSAPESSPALGETSVLPNNCESVHRASSRYFMDLHQSLCNMISRVVDEVSVETLLEWLKKSKSDSDQKDGPKSLVRHKNGPRILDILKPSKGREIWVTYGGVRSTLSNLLSQLETYMFIRKCPFPHVIRAGAIFIPIYVVKEKIFSTLSGTAIDQVLQEHKVELRPTTLSEEKQLIDFQLKGCTSRLMKLLSLKQLPEIYPDLISLFWHSCIKHRLGEPSDETLKGDTISNQQVCSDDKKDNLSSEPEGLLMTQSTPKQQQKGRYKGKRRKKRGKKTHCKSLAHRTSLEADAALPQPSSCSTSETDQETKQSSSTYPEVTSCPTPDTLSSSLGTKLQRLRQTKGRKEKRAVPFRGNGINVTTFEKSGSSLVLKLTRVPLPNDFKRKTLNSNQDQSGSAQLQVMQLEPQNTNLPEDSKLPSPKPHCPKDPSPLKFKVTQVSHKNKRADEVLRRTRSTSKVLHLRSSVVHIKFRRLLNNARKQSLRRRSASLRKPGLLSDGAFRQQRGGNDKHPIQGKDYPDLVGKRIRHLYEENDKTESWYRGVVVRVHERHQNPLKTVYEVKYDSEPEWKYYLELLQDYEKGWLRFE